MKTPGFIKVVDRELRIISENSSSKMLLLWIPAITFVLLAFIYQAGAIRKVSVAIHDQDNTKLSRLLVQFVNSSPDMKVTYYLDSGDDLESFFLNHNEKAIYNIPHGFEKTILRGEQANFQVFTNSSNIVYGNVLQRDALLIGATLSAGVSIEKLVAQGLSPDQAFNLTMPISVNAKPLFNPIYNYLNYLLPGLMTVLLQMILFFVTTRCINGEIGKGTFLELLSVANKKPINILIGKAIAYFLMGFAIMMYIALVFFMFDIPFKDKEMDLLILFSLFILVNIMLGMMLSATIEDEILALDIAFFYNSPAFVFSGFTFPMFGMPFFDSLYADFIPYTHFLHAFFKVYQIGAPVNYMFPELLVLALFLLVALVSTYVALKINSKWKSRFFTLNFSHEKI